MHHFHLVEILDSPYHLPEDSLYLKFLNLLFRLQVVSEGIACNTLHYKVDVFVVVAALVHFDYVGMV